MTFNSSFILGKKKNMAVWFFAFLLVVKPKNNWVQIDIESDNHFSDNRKWKTSVPGYQIRR